MNEVLLEDHMEDADIYFNSCYGLMGKKYIRYRGKSGDEIYLHVIGKSKSEDLQISLDKAKKIVFPTVEAGAINVKQGSSPIRSIYLDRRPIRQFAWGFNNNSYQSKYIDRDIARRMGYGGISFGSYAMLEGALNSEYYTGAEAVELLLSGEAISVALDKAISLSFKWGSPTIQVFNHLSMVGECVDEGVRLYPEAQHCKEVVSQYFNIIEQE